MVSRVNKEDKKNFPVWIIVIAVVFGIIFLYVILSDDSNSSTNYPTKVYQPSSNFQKVTEEPQDNLPQCPTGDKTDSGQKTDDWFGCSDVKALLSLKVNNDKTDCSNQNNFQTSKFDFHIIRYCEANIGGQSGEWYGNEDNCETLYEGKLKPQVRYEAFPSLNEYKFYGVGIGINNIGCTKENLSDYMVLYGLYQNNQPIAFNYAVLGQGYFGNQILEPQAGNDYFVTQVGFGESSLYSNNPIARTNSDGYTFKICLFNKQKSLVLSCDWADFDMKYKP